MDHRQLEALGCSLETVERAMKLHYRAKPRTAPGSGHALGPLSTSLVPICALLASEQLNNGEITLDVARAAACIEKAKFNKAVQIVRAALDIGTSSKKPPSFSGLLESYVHHPLLKAQLEKYCNQTEREAKALGMRSADLKANETICTIFYWVCAAAKLKELPEALDFAKTHSISGKRISELAASLSKKLAPLRKQIGEETKILTVRTSSPTKNATALATPRRSGRQHREILTKESVKKRPATTPTETPSKAAQYRDDDDDDSAMSFPETPTKRKRLETSPSKTISSKSLFPVAAASSSRLILDDDLELPQTPRKSARAALKGSPLKKSIALAEVSGISDDEEPESRCFRRFRPVYLEQKRWSARDPRLKRLLKAGEKRKLEYFQMHGNPFELVET